MRPARHLLRVGEYLVGRACRHLPHEVRAERYREWAAELPAILGDPGVRPAWRRPVRMLRYTLGIRVSAVALAPRPRRRTIRASTVVWITFISASCAYQTWYAVKGTPDWVNYVSAGYSLALLLAFPAVWRWKSRRPGHPRQPNGGR
jgi:hypothetical protein